MTFDGIYSYLYDAKGRICAVASTPFAGMTAMTGYLYDGGGTRVAKGTITSWSCDAAVNGFHTINDYVLGLGGEQVTEMGTDTTVTDTGMTTGLAWQHTNVWAGGKLLGTYDKDGLHFYLNDPLGTRRAQTDYAGVIEQTCQSLPFGDGLSCTGSTVAPTEHHFTGKEHDTESGNDYFMARYYSSNMGRFMSPDWSAQAEPVPYANLDNPQSLNLYSYAGNNPLSRTDADGHFWQELKNLFQYGHWVNNAGLESALAKDAQRDLAQMAKQGVTVNGKPSGQIFNGLTNKQIVDGYNYVEGVLATQKMMSNAKAQDAAILGALTQMPGGSRPSTGRTEPQNLNEQLAMEQAKSNPSAGTEIPLKGGMKDPNYPGSDGWVKMSQNVNGTEIHYVRNINTGEVADFKFK